MGVTPGARVSVTPFRRSEHTVLKDAVRALLDCIVQDHALSGSDWETLLRIVGRTEYADINPNRIFLGVDE